MVKQAGTIILLLSLLGALAIPVEAADPSSSRELRRGVFNPFAIRPTIRTGRFFPLSWFGGAPAETKVQQDSPVVGGGLPTLEPTPAPAIQSTGNEGGAAMNSAICDDDAPVRSPFRPAPRGAF